MSMMQPEGFRIVNEISAKYIGKKSNEDYEFICMATTARALYWNESINTICTVRHDESVPDNEAVLYVKKFYIGSCSSSDDWYAFYPDGTIKNYWTHPLDSNSDDKKWLVDDETDLNE